MLGTRVARWLGEDPDDGWAMLLPVVIVSVVAARIYHVIHLWDFYRENPVLIPQIWNGGIGIPGAVAGGALAILVYTRMNGIHTARWLDIFAPARRCRASVRYGCPSSWCRRGWPVRLRRRPPG